MTVPRRERWTPEQFDQWARQRGFESWADMQRGIDAAAEGSYPDIEAARERAEEWIKSKPGQFEPR